MAGRQHVTSGAPWEALAGYTRALRVGDTVYVAGTTAVTKGKVVFPGDAAAQARHIYSIIEQALSECGSSLADVVRARTYLTRSEDSEAVMRVQGEVFQAIRPAATLVAVAALVDPEMLVEIEVEAVIGSA